MNIKPSSSCEFLRNSLYRSFSPPRTKRVEKDSETFEMVLLAKMMELNGSSKLIHRGRKGSIIEPP